MKTLYPDLFPETLLVSAEAGRVFTTSLTVAENFSKRHTHVLRATEILLADLSTQPNFGLSENTSQPNFWPANEPNFGPINERNFAFIALNFERISYLDSRGRTKPMYKMTHDGFALLAMGFTGREALAWKVKFLAAFRDMERQLLAQQEREANALYQLRPRWQPIVQHPELNRQKLLGLTGHRSARSITACRRRMRQVGLLR